MSKRKEEAKAFIQQMIENAITTHVTVGKLVSEFHHGELHLLVLIGWERGFRRSFSPVGINVL